jgi:hypothetical protein
VSEQRLDRQPRLGRQTVGHLDPARARVAEQEVQDPQVLLQLRVF